MTTLINPSCPKKYTYYISGGIRQRPAPPIAGGNVLHTCGLEYRGDWKPGDGDISVSSDESILENGYANDFDDGAYYTSVEILVLDPDGNIQATNASYSGGLTEEQDPHDCVGRTPSFLPASVGLTKDQIRDGVKLTPNGPGNCDRWCGNTATDRQDGPIHFLSGSTIPPTIKCGPCSPSTITTNLGGRGCDKESCAVENKCGCGPGKQDGSNDGSRVLTTTTCWGQPTTQSASMLPESLSEIAQVVSNLWSTIAPKYPGAPQS